ncbi:hypothetical protein [Gordonia sp. IITR100]|uniref:hypothetical protein n=1 Tax=Gordonia sp. IITR100 TaxID=1314686 RepID=UPI0011161334|nr:hypothetical protein [Gordonia sp. IITR100]
MGEAITHVAPPPADSASTPSTLLPPWRPGSDEPAGPVKIAAATFVESVGTWRPSTARSAPPPIAGAKRSIADSTTLAQRLAARGYARNLVPDAGLLDATSPAAVTRVRYPQLGGLTDSEASVVVSAVQFLDGGREHRDVLIDVRLRKRAGLWTIIPSPSVADRPALRSTDPSTAASTVLANPRIAMSDPTRAEIAARVIDDRILRLLTGMSGKYHLTVQVARTGHPGTVFPTPRTSNHARGLAVDIRAVNGRNVVDIAQTDPLLAEFMLAARRLGSTEVGGPIPISGPEFFTDPVHQDHIHIGIDEPQ